MSTKSGAISAPEHRGFAARICAVRSSGDAIVLKPSPRCRGEPQPVLFAQTLLEMARSGITHFVELGPHPALHHASTDTFRDAGIDAVYITTLRREGDDASELARVRGELDERVAEVAAYVTLQR